MLRDITLGQYYAVDSTIHRLDPRVKLIGTIAYIVSLFAFKSVPGFVIAALFLATIVKVSKVPFSYMVRGLKSIIMLLGFTAFLNIFLIRGETVLFHYGIITITLEGLSSAAFMIVRLIFLIIGTSVMTLTTTPNQLTDGMESLLMPFAKVKLPVHEIAMMMSIALRFIPVLIEETDKIMKAQAARGADFESGNIFRRIKNMVPILVPLFVSAFRRANDLAVAMEARCYRGGSGRTKMKPLKFQSKDWTSLGILVIYFAVLILVKKVL